MDRGLRPVKTRYLTLVGIVVLLFGARVWLATGGATPDGQPPLVDLHSLDGLKADFNREAAKMRVIISIAPTCPYCLKGATEIERILRRRPDHQVVLFNVWQPILATDWGKPGTGALASSCRRAGAPVLGRRAPGRPRARAIVRGTRASALLLF